MRLFAFVVCCFLLAGCSGQPAVVNANKADATAQADYNECRANAAIATALPSVKDPEAASAKLVDECMKAKGYKVQ